MSKNIRQGSIAWYVMDILRNNNNKQMHWKEILQKVQEEKKLKGSTPEATLISILIRNKDIFTNPKKGWYKLR